MISGSNQQYFIHENDVGFSSTIQKEIPQKKAKRKAEEG